MFCSKCGKEVSGNFCENCGTPINPQPENQTPTNQPNQNDAAVNEYIKEKMQNAKEHNTYRLITGIIMSSLGALILYFCLKGSFIERAGDGAFLGIILPAILILAGGILSIISRNKDKKLLLISGICLIVAAISNVIGSSNITLLFVLSIVIGIINCVFYSKLNK